jgi:hypothetical protein
MKGNIMADSSPLAGLLDRAARILKLVGELADAIQGNEHSPGDETQRRIATAWKALFPAIVEAGESLPSDPSPIADWIREVGRVSKWFDGAVRQHGLAEVLFRFNCDGFIRVADEGQSLFREMAAKHDPFAFVESPSASNPLGIGTTPATPKPPNQFAAVESPKQVEPPEAASDTPTPTKPKRSTERGEGRAKLIAALTKHHQYADGGCLNLNPIGNNELAKAAGVSASTASAFFNDKFQGHTKYKALCRDAGKLTAALKLLNDEFAPYHLLGAASSDLAAPVPDDADSES